MQQAKLETMIKTIGRRRQEIGKKRYTNYVIANEDEPYAKEVWKFIKDQWIINRTKELLGVK